MNVGIVSTTNQKGQIVIPASMRMKLGITEHVPLQIVLQGNAIHIVPITHVITAQDTENSYLSLLNKTQGSWKKAENTENQQQELELQASAQRKNAW